MMEKNRRSTASGVSTMILACLVLILVIGMAACSKRSIDLAASKDFAPLVGLCVEFRTDMAATPLQNNVYMVDPISAVPNGKTGGDEYLDVAAGSTVTINEIRFVNSHSGSSLYIRGQFTTADGQIITVDLNRVFDSTWDWETREKLRKGEKVDIDSEHLPFVHPYVKECAYKE